MDFAIKDCALATSPQGDERRRSARCVISCGTSTRLRVPPLLGTLLRPQSSDREFNNDFASWSLQSLHDNRMAERLAVIDPMDSRTWRSAPGGHRGHRRAAR